MDLGLNGKRVLVTGSTAGIGLACARVFAAEGAHVILNGRSDDRVRSAVEALRRASPGVSIEGVRGDLGSAAGCENLIARVPEVDVLVNNVGIFEAKPFEEIPDADWLRFFEMNVMSGVRLSRHYVGAMRRRNWGRIVFVSSESALRIPTEMIHYGMTKTAQLAIARGLAQTLEGTGVTVNSVLAGPTLSEGVGNWLTEVARGRGVDQATLEQEFFTTMRPASIIRRFESAEEVAAMIVYVCSARASATTGSALRVDGGAAPTIP